MNNITSFKQYDHSRALEPGDVVKNPWSYPLRLLELSAAGYLVPKRGWLDTNERVLVIAVIVLPLVRPRKAVLVMTCTGSLGWLYSNDVGLAGDRQ